MINWEHPLLTLPLGEAYRKLANGSKPTFRHILGYLGELELRDEVPDRFLLDCNPLGNIGDWIRHVGKGTDFLFKAGRYKIAVERKVCSGYVSRAMVERHWIPRFKTDKYGKRLRRVDFKIAVINEDIHLSPRIRDELYQVYDIRVMEVAEFVEFLNFLENAEHITYNCYRYLNDFSCNDIIMWTPKLSCTLTRAPSGLAVFDIEPPKLVPSRFDSDSARG